MADPTSTETQDVDYGTSTLFRFSIVRNPQPIVKKSKAQTILTRPQSSGGSNARTSEEFITTIPELKEINEDLFYAGEWVAEHKNNFTVEEALTAFEGVSVLDGESEQLIWDSIFAQLKSGREEIILIKLVNVVRANEIAKQIHIYEVAIENEENPSAEDLKVTISALADASISIPSEELPSIDLPEASPVARFNPEQQKMLKTRQNAAVASFRASYFEQSFAKVDKLKRRYDRMRNEAYAKAVEAFNVLMTQWQANNIPPETEDPESPWTAEPLPVFNFEFDNFSLETIKDDECNEDLNDLIESVQSENPCCNTVSKFEEYCQEQKEKALQEFNRNIPFVPFKMASYKEHEIVIDNHPPHNSLLLRLVRLLPFQEKYSLLVTHYNRENSTPLGIIDLTATINTTILDGKNEKKVVGQSEDFTTYLLFENVIPLESVKEVELNGTIYDEDGNFSQEVAITLIKDVNKLLLLDELKGTGSAQRNTESDGIPGTDKNPIYGLKKVGVLDYMRVEQEVCCYVPGEVSHIENIMAREYKEKMTRLLTREEITTEEAEEREEERTKDVSSTDRYELHKEISQMLSKEQSQQIGVNAGVNASYNGGAYQVGVTAGTNLNFSSSNSQNTTSNVAESIAKEVVTKATERLVKKVSYKRIAKMLREHEETNKHGFDNRQGDKNVTGIYRWVDKIFKNTVFNYGKRLIYDFMIPEPSKNFKYWMSNLEVKDPIKPEPPMYPGNFVGKSSGFDWTDLNRTNFAKIAAQFGADVQGPLPHEMYLNKPIAEASMKNFNASSDKKEGDRAKMPIINATFELEIPDGYFADRISVEGACKPYPGDEGGNLRTWSSAWLTVGSKYYWFGGNTQIYSGSSPGQFDSIQNIEKKLTIALTSENNVTFEVNVTAHCQQKQDTYDTWRQVTYTAIMEAYNKKLQAYKDALLAYVAPEKPKVDYNYNPGEGRIIEGRELKRLCIEMMTMPLGYPPTLADHYSDATSCNLSYYVNQRQKLDDQARLINFLEQAFEWDLMSYTFMPYFYAQRTQWETLIKQKGTNDPLFEAFLQSGMARVSLTVRPGFERLVLFFLDTGIISTADNFVPGGSEDWYESIADLAKLPEKTQEGLPWETRVPTDLVIIQAGAQPLGDYGLPCKCNHGVANAGLGLGDSTMKPFQSDYGAIISDVKDALVEVVQAIGEVSNNNSGDGGTTTPTNP